MRLLIVGSCVSRDALGVDADSAGVDLVGYRARSSLAVLGSPAVEPPPDLHQLKSPFRRRMVIEDHGKTLLRSIETMDFDLLLLDLIDERFHLLQTPSGGIITVSAEYASAVGKTRPGQIIRAFSERHATLWRQGFSLLLASLRRCGKADRLRVNRVYWASRRSDGLPIAGFDAGQITAANEFLAARYADITLEVGNSQFFDYESAVLSADPSHRWGLSPFHYMPEFYSAQMAQLRATASANWRVSLRQSGEQLSAQICSGCFAIGTQFAFYLMQGGRRVSMQWYGDSPEAQFDGPLLAAEHHAIAFSRPTAQDKPTIRRSNTVDYVPPSAELPSATSIQMSRSQSGNADEAQAP